MLVRRRVYSGVSGRSGGVRFLESGSLWHIKQLVSLSAGGGVLVVDAIEDVPNASDVFSFFEKYNVPAKVVLFRDVECRFEDRKTGTSGPYDRDRLRLGCGMCVDVC